MFAYSKFGIKKIIKAMSLNIIYSSKIFSIICKLFNAAPFLRLSATTQIFTRSSSHKSALTRPTETGFLPSACSTGLGDKKFSFEYLSSRLRI